MGDRDRYLLDMAKKGNAAAFEELIEIHQKKVYNIALRMMGNPDDASELAQEAFIKAYRSIRNFREESTFSTWIYRIATNVCLDELRKRKNRNVVYLDEDFKLEDGDMKRQVEDSAPTPDAIYERAEISRVVNEAIQSLSEEHRLVLILRDIQGYSYEEISEMLKCPEGTIKSRINRGRQALKDLLLSRKELLGEWFVK